MCVAVFQNKTSVKKTYLPEGHGVMGQQVPAPKSTAGIQVSQSQLPTHACHIHGGACPPGLPTVH